MTQQELLDGYATARCSVIHERSGDFDTDMRALYEEVAEYAEANGLTIPLDVFDGYVTQIA